MGVESIINAAVATFGQGGYQYKLGGKGGDANGDGLKEVDCSNVVGVALKQAGVVTGVAANSFTTTSLFNGTTLTELAQEKFDRFAPKQVIDGASLQAGDLILWKSTTNSGQHIGIFDHYDQKGDPVFFGSQTSTGPAFATIGGSTKSTWTGGAFEIMGALRAKPAFYVPELDQTGADGTGISTPRIAARVNLLKTQGVEGFRPGIYSNGADGIQLQVADASGQLHSLSAGDILEHEGYAGRVQITDADGTRWVEVRQARVLQAANDQIWRKMA